MRGKVPTQRGLKVGEEIRRALSAIFREAALWEQGLAEIPITLSEVRVTPDLRQAHVFVLPVGGAVSNNLLAKKLGRAAPRLKKELAQRTHLRVIPQLVFHVDTAIDHVQYIDHLLNDPRVKRDIDKSDA